VLSTKKEIPVLKAMATIPVTTLTELRSKIGDQGINFNASSTRSSEKLLVLIVPLESIPYLTDASYYLQWHSGQ
jgi:hypothetical protein